MKRLVIPNLVSLVLFCAQKLKDAVENIQKLSKVWGFCIMNSTIHDNSKRSFKPDKLGVKFHGTYEKIRTF